MTCFLLDANPTPTQIEDANLGLHVESDFGEAAAQAVKLAKGL